MNSIILSAFTLCTLTVAAQPDKYVEAMKKNLAQLDAGKTSADFQAAANAFERIGDAEKTQWLPYYYAGLALTRSGWIDTKLDKNCVQRRRLLRKMRKSIPSAIWPPLNK